MSIPSKSRQRYPLGDFFGDLFDDSCEEAPPLDYPLVYIWGNNEVRATRKGSRCRLLAEGSLGSILIEFPDGYRMITSRRAVRRAADAPTR